MALNIKGKWQPVAIDCEDGLDLEQLEGLVSFEELTDYTITDDKGKVTCKDRFNLKTFELDHEMFNIKSKFLSCIYAVLVATECNTAKILHSILCMCTYCTTHVSLYCTVPWTTKTTAVGFSIRNKSLSSF